MNTHFDIHIGTNTCVVKLGGVVFDPRQVQVVISALHVLVLAVQSPDWPPVDTLLRLCCCSLTETVISPTEKRWIPKKYLSHFKIFTWFCGSVWFGWSQNKPYPQGRGRNIVGRLDD